MGHDIPIIGPILNRIIGTRNDRFVKKYNQRVAQITALEPAMNALTDEQIQGKVLEFRARLDKGEKSESIMIDAFAVAREAMDRAVGIRNIFNPRHNFDPGRLPPDARAMYDQVKAVIDVTPPAEPTGTFLGGAEPIPSYQFVPIPPALYQAVRALYPESRPPFRARPFDVQLIGGMVLTQGKISEMKTGEGKTIVGPLATYLACIERLKVHVVTVNDYLVQRDRDWTFPFFHALGLTIGAIHPQHQQPEHIKREMYRCDVVYGTTSEFGFDYLRDNMKRSADEQVQKKRHFAIVDEVDSILIDEARTPLIISGPAHEDSPRYDLADRLARHLVDKQRPWDEANEKVDACKKLIKGLEGDMRQAREKGRIPELQERLKQAKSELIPLEQARDKHTQYYEVKPERKSSHLTHEGVAEAQRAAGIGSFYVDQNIDVPHLLEQSLRAHAVYERDKDYVVMPTPDPQTGRQVPGIVIVDTNTGRPMVGRQWSDGLHQAIECKEKVQIKQETQTVATITIQNFFKMYKRLAGMTGTADTEAQEFHDIYKLDVVAIPTNRHVSRYDYDDLVFLTGKDKWNLITDEIKAFHDVGRPILVGTTSVEKSETLSKMLTARHAVQHEVLNAKQHEREAHIIENAGQLGAVMIATNMAGRGTDIKLGQLSRQQLLDHWLRRGIAPRTVTIESTEEQLREAIFRKIAPSVLETNKRELESVPFAELELMLLRHWAMHHTWEDQGKIDKMNAAQLRDALDSHGRFILHRVRWYNTIEDMGGLHVVGTERHEARRIDNQLRGRSGRQGDNGSSRFYVSLDDDLMKMFAGETTMKVLSRLGMKEGDAIEHPMLSKSVERAQRKVEERNFQMRKNLLDYDEVMEHQRQRFYGMRQRVLEGRDVKGLLLEFIEDATRDAVQEYLDPDYPSQRVSEWVRNTIDSSISADRFRGKTREEIIETVIKEAKYDARQMIDLTLGEYMPMEGSEVAVEFDSAGLVGWAKTRFGVDLDAGSLRAGGVEERAHVRETLTQAAEERIDQADYSSLDPILVENFAASELASWFSEKFAIPVTADEILKAKAKSAAGDEGEITPLALLMGKVRDLYARREAEYPVEFAMDMTMAMMRQSPAEAAARLVGWGNMRFKLGWTPETLRKTPPKDVREQLLAASKAFCDSGELDKEIAAATACDTDAKLDDHFKARFGFGIPDAMRYLEGQERADAIRSRVENILRSELLSFERTILLETFDNTWRDHLYAMDQLRDTISYRAFSQQDPRIEYKREGSHMFLSMMQTVRDRVTDFVFKAKLSAAAMMGMDPAAAPRPSMPSPMPRPQMAAPPRPVSGGAGGPGGGSISGPGLDGGGTVV